MVCPKRNKEISDFRKQINDKIHHGKLPPDAALFPLPTSFYHSSGSKTTTPFCRARFFVL
jgi:carbonic anhydrase